MNFFTDELKKITDRSEYIQNPKFVGQSCVFRLSDDVTGKLGFITQGYADNYTALKLTLLNKREGPIDVQVMNITDVIGLKTVRGDLSETVDDYLSRFAEQELSEDEELNISLN